MFKQNIFAPKFLGKDVLLEHLSSLLLFWAITTFSKSFMVSDGLIKLAYFC